MHRPCRRGRQVGDDERYEVRAGRDNGVHVVVARVDLVLGVQELVGGVLVVGIYAFALSWVLLKAVDAVMGLRLSEESELQGLDLSEHSETAYS